ncbi:Endonuclease/exonuclease/phosphatase [Crassisporium funariophilum]|nr:Endonuclease/exonuclease/phosphatase [Crassisporium funariophilum]
MRLAFWHSSCCQTPQFLIQNTLPPQICLSAHVMSHLEAAIQATIDRTTTSDPYLAEMEVTSTLDKHVDRIYQLTSFYDPTTSVWSPRPGLDQASDGVEPVSISSFSVVTWNVDFMQPRRHMRLQAILSYLQTSIIDLSANAIPTIILLQEVDETVFKTLLERPFIRDFYEVTDTHCAAYATVTLIPKSLTKCVIGVFRTVFPSSLMGRDALYVDFMMSPILEGSQQDGEIIRVVNTHLESLRGKSDSARIKQLGSIARSLVSVDIYGGLVGGDMNAIGPDDKGLPERLGLVDAWTACPPTHIDNEADVEAARVEQREIEGHTWGYQPTSIYPPRRLDKILLAGHLKTIGIERIGVGLKVDSTVESDCDWASDHYGLFAQIQVAAPPVKQRPK